MSKRSSMSNTRRNASLPIRRVSTLKDAIKEVEAGASRRSSSCDLPVRRGTLPLPSDLDILSYQFALRDKGKGEDSRPLCPGFKRRIFASCISTYAKKVILKTWLIRIIFAFGMGMAAGAFLQVIIDEGAKPSTLAWYSTISSSANALINILLMSSRSHYSDAFGRKTVLFVAFLSHAVSQAVMAIHPTMITSLIVATIPAIFSIYKVVIKAVTADVLPTRPKIIAQIDTYANILEAIFAFLGFGAGSGMIRLLDVPLYWLFVGNVCCLFANMFLVSILPETLDESRKSKVISKEMLEGLEGKEPFTWNVFKSIRGHFRVIHMEKRVMWLLYCGFITAISTAGGFGMYGGFLMEQLGWTIEEIFIATIVGGICGTISGLCSGQLIKWFGAPLLMKISLPWTTVTKAAAAFVTGYYYFYALMLLNVPLGPQFSVAKGSYTTSIVPSGYQTRIKGAASMLNSIAKLVFANFYSLIFWYFTSDDAFIYFPGAAILVGAIIRAFAIPFLLKAPIWNKEPLEDVVKEEIEKQRRASCPV